MQSLSNGESVKIHSQFLQKVMEQKVAYFPVLDENTSDQINYNFFFFLG